LITAKSTLADLPPGVLARTERLSHCGQRSALLGKPNWSNLRFRYRSSGECRLKRVRSGDLAAAARLPLYGGISAAMLVLVVVFAVLAFH
jgi:hypothetical protein